MRTDLVIQAKTHEITVETLDVAGNVMATWTFNPADPPTAMHVGAHAIRITHGAEHVKPDPSGDVSVSESAPAVDNAG